MAVPSIALAAFVVGVFLYYKPDAHAGVLPAVADSGKYPGHIDELLTRGHQFFEDPLFFLRKY